VWTSRLAGEPRIGAWPWSSLQLACDGDEVYAAAGVGVIVGVEIRKRAPFAGRRLTRDHFARRASALGVGYGLEGPGAHDGDRAELGFPMVGTRIGWRLMDVGSSSPRAMRTD
jgi:hypothetical protein